MNPPSKPLPLLAAESSQPDAISDLISTLNSLFPRCLIFDFSAVCNTWFIHSFNSICHVYSVSTMYETAGIKRWKPSAPWPEEAKVSDWTPAAYSVFPRRPCPLCLALLLSLPFLFGLLHNSSTASPLVFPRVLPSALTCHRESNFTATHNGCKPGLSSQKVRLRTPLAPIVIRLWEITSSSSPELQSKVSYYLVAVLPEDLHATRNVLLPQNMTLLPNALLLCFSC